MTGESRRGWWGARSGFGLGLRLQVTCVLLCGFALLVALLGVSTRSLAARALREDRRRTLQTAARAWLAVTDGASDAEVRAALRGLVASRGVLGVAWTAGREVIRLGEPTDQGRAVVASAAGQQVRILFSAPEASGLGRALGGLLFLYVTCTGAAITWLMYAMLTRLVVRPVEALTVVAEGIAAGRSAPAPMRGAAEVVRLSVAVHAMQQALAAADAGKRRRLEELEQKTVALEQAQHTLVRSEKMASVGRLAAGVAHEIGNPLAAILGLLELVQRGGLSREEEREFLRRVEKETERIQGIIRNLLDFSRVEPPPHDGTRGADEPRADLRQVVEDALRLVGPQKDLRDITVERRFAEGLDPVCAAAGPLTQVVLNLLLNAADAIEGAGTIRVEVQPGEAPHTVTLTVDDTGSGFSPEDAPHLFEPFFTTKPKGRGTGLGLAVSLAIVDHYQGTLQAHRLPQGGARFTVTLPAA